MQFFQNNLSSPEYTWDKLQRWLELNYVCHIYAEGKLYAWDLSHETDEKKVIHTP